MDVDLSKIKPGDEVTVSMTVSHVGGSKTHPITAYYARSQQYGLSASDIVSHTPKPLAVGDRVKLRAWADAPRCATSGNVLAVHEGAAWVQWPSLRGPCTEKIDALVRVND
jgi:hypothetical protein